LFGFGFGNAGSETLVARLPQAVPPQPLLRLDGKPFRNLGTAKRISFLYNAR
jgi:hypothetical protein